MLSNMLTKVVGSTIVICLCCVSISSSSSKVHLNKRIPKKSKRFWTFSSMQKRQFRLRRTRGTRGTSAFRLLRCGSPRGKIRRDTDAVLWFCLFRFSRTFQEKFPKDPPKKNWNKYFSASFWKNTSWKKQYFSLATFLCKILGVSSRLTCFFCPLFLQNVLFIRSLRSSLSFTNSSPRRPWVPHVSAFETKSGKGSGVFWDMKKKQKKRYVFFCQIILKYYMIDMIWSYSYRICKWYISW